MKEIWILCLFVGLVPGGFPTSQNVVPIILNELDNIFQAYIATTSFGSNFGDPLPGDAAKTASSLECIFHNLTSYFQNASVPITINTNFNHDTPVLRLVGYLQNVSVNHLTEYDIKNITVYAPSKSEIRYFFNVSFDQIKLEGEYDLDFNVLTLYPLYGQGHFWLMVKNFNTAFELSTSLDQEPSLNFTQAEVTEFDFSLGQLLINVENFVQSGGFSDVFGEILTDITANILMQLKSYLTPVIQFGGSSLINSAIKQKKIISTAEIYTFLNGTAANFLKNNYTCFL